MKAHEHLYRIAVKLSIYSSALDFGLMLSIFLLNSKVLPYSLSTFLTNTFSLGISYLTAAIIALFALSFILRTKQKFVTIRVTDKRPEYKPIKIRVTTLETHKDEPGKVYIKQPINPIVNQEPVIQRVANDSKSFVKVNGVWYLAERDRFERVKVPDLH